MMFIISPEQPQSGGIEQFTDTSNKMMDHRIIQIQSNGTTIGGNHMSNNSSNQNFNSIITNFHNNNNNNTTTSCSSSSSSGSNSMTAFTTNTTSQQQTLMSSKLLVLHPEQFNDAYPEGNDGGGGNGVGNIVLLATEQMDISSADHDVINNNILNGVGNTNGGGVAGVNTDEELTPLTWLHDKNLLKGINLSCAKVQSSPESQQMTAPLSPTSDFVEDSCVSEDNISSTNSTSDQSIGVYCTESPTKSTYSLTYHTSALMKNRRQSPSLMSTTSTSSEIGSPIYEHHYNSSVDSKLLSSPASTVSIASSNSYSSGTPHQHFHKKYLREEHVKTMRESGGGHNGNLLTTKTEYTTVKLENGLDNTVKNEYCSSPSPTYEMTTNYDRMVGNGGQSNKSMASTNSREPSAPTSSSTSNNNKSANSQKQKHPTNVPYDPLVHITSKPPYSFSSLIFMAIEDSQQKALPVKEIYAWIVMHFPYFKTAPTGWKNSVRHNLSLNKCFQKVEKAANLGKGSLWMVENQFRPNLLQALTRSPFHPCSTLDKNAYVNKSVVTATARTTTESPPTVTKSGSRLPDPQHFPFLAKRLAAMEDDQRGDQDSTSRSSTPTLDDEGNGYGYGGEHRYTTVTYSTDSQRPADYTTVTTLSTDSSIEDVNAATAMLALKHGPKVFEDSFGGNPPVITSSPSEDHTYSAGISVSGSVTNGQTNGVIVRAVNGGEQVTGVTEYEDSNDEGHHNLHADEPPLPDSESEEQRRHAEGVDALLNLAGIINYSTAPSPVQNGVTTTTTTIVLKRPASLSLGDGHAYKNQIQYHHEQQNGSATQYAAQHQQFVLSSPTPAKKLKTSSSRSLKSRLKKKSWLR